MQHKMGLGLADTRRGVVAAPPTAPAAFAAGQWNLTDAGTGGQATLAILALPADGGSAITTLQYRIGAGAWTALATVAAGTHALQGFADGVAASVLVRAGNAIGTAPDSDSKTVTTSSGVITLRQQIDNLRTGNTPNGRQSSNALKVPGVDALPAGMAIAGDYINNTSYAGNLADWDFRGYGLAIQTAMGDITNCLLGEPVVKNLNAYVDVYASGSVGTIEYCTFSGPSTFATTGAAINQRASGSGVSATGGDIALIRYNRFEGLATDTIKTMGNPTGQIIEWNYFGPPVNLPAIPTLYSAATSYALGAVIKTANGNVFRSLQAANLNNTPPATKVDTAFWDSLDPHSDAITTVGVIGSLIVRRNLFDWTDDPIGPTGPFAATGHTNAFRLSRNSGTSYPLGPVTVEENVAYYGAFQSYPVEVADGGQANFTGPVAFQNNWLQRNVNSLVWHPNSNGVVDTWVNNRDALSDALIPGPTLRVSAQTAVLVGLGQSEFAYISESTSFYRQLSPPTLRATADFTLHQRNGTGTGAATSTTKTRLAPGNIASVNPAMVVLANALDYIFPASKFAYVDATEVGTSRTQLVDNADTTRIWARTADIVTEAEADYGNITRVAEFWYASDLGAMPNWLANFAPVYYGENPNGTNFVLGSTRTTATIATSAVIDNCLWDFESGDPAVKGRGLFKRTTPLDIVRKGSWGETTATPWQGIDTFVADSRFQALGGKYGPHACGWFSDGHPIVTDPHGIYEAAFDFVFPSFLRARGLNIVEPAFTTVNIGPGGAYLDIAFPPQNGGVLSTKRRVKGLANPASPSIYWQEVMGFEVLRIGDLEGRFAICRPGAAGIAPKYQGTVTIQNATTVRITPVVPFASGDRITYQYGSGFCRDASSGAAYVYPDIQRNSAEKWMLDLPIEHVAAYTDPAAAHPFCGFGLKTFAGPFDAPGLPAPASWFSMGSAGPQFRDPATVPANTTAIEYRFQVRVPASVASVTGSRRLAVQDNLGWDINLSTNAGATSLFISNLRNALGTSVAPADGTVVPSPARDTWYEVAIEADLVNRVVRRTVNGTPLADVALTGPTTDATFQTGRRVGFLSDNGGTSGTRLQQGVQIAYLEVWFTTGGSKTLRKRIAGNAATVNADAWKLGGDAT